jgi:hypothetical protein
VSTGGGGGASPTSVTGGGGDAGSGGGTLYAANTYGNRTATDAGTYVKTESTLVFDPISKRLGVIGSDGEVIDYFDAHNLTDSTSNGSIKPGTYSIGEPIPNTGDRSNRIPSQGSYFIPIYGVENRSELGIHAGRTPQTVTMGCLRVSQPTLNSMINIYSNHPYHTIIVGPMEP